MGRGRKASPDSARENLHIRVQKDDLSRIRATVDNIRSLVDEMRELGITDLPPRTVGGMVSKSLSVYADMLEDSCRKVPEFSSYEKKVVAYLDKVGNDVELSAVAEATDVPEMFVRLVMRRYKAGKYSS